MGHNIVELEDSARAGGGGGGACLRGGVDWAERDVTAAVPATKLAGCSGLGPCSGVKVAGLSQELMTSVE